MTCTNRNIILSLIALFFASATSAQNISIAQNVSIAQNISFTVRTTMEVEALSAPTIQAIGTAMDKIGTELDIAVVQTVTGNVTANSVRQLRGNIERKLCTNCPRQSGPLCFFHPGIVEVRCRRSLTMHEELPEDELVNLTVDDHAQYLYIADRCEKAKDEVTSIILAAAKEGIIPLLPLGSQFEQTCFYEIVN